MGVLLSQVLSQGSGTAVYAGVAGVGAGAGRKSASTAIVVVHSFTMVVHSEIVVNNSSKITLKSRKFVALDSVGLTGSPLLASSPCSIFSNNGFFLCSSSRHARRWFDSMLICLCLL